MKKMLFLLIVSAIVVLASFSMAEEEQRKSKGLFGIIEEINKNTHYEPVGLSRKELDKLEASLAEPLEPSRGEAIQVLLIKAVIVGLLGAGVYYLSIAKRQKELLKEQKKDNDPHES